MLSSSQFVFRRILSSNYVSKGKLGIGTTCLRSFHQQNPLCSSFPLKSATNSSFPKPSSEQEPKSDSMDKISDKVGAETESVAVKKTMKERMIIFWKSLITDYLDVFKEAYKDGKAKPGKSALYAVIFGTLGYFLWSNPSETDFYDEYLENRSKIANLGTLIRNSKSEDHVLNLGKLLTKGRIRYQSLGFFSVMWMHDVDSCVGIFDARCSYITPILTEARERFLDIGFANRWWVLDGNMIDYDVNESEWELEEQLKYNSSVRSATETKFSS